MNRILAFVAVMALGFASLGYVGTGRKTGNQKKYTEGGSSGPPPPSEGTAARTWSHAYNFSGCQASPDYNTIPDLVGSLDLPESGLTTYSCAVATAPLNVTSIGIPVDSAMNVDGACWGVGAGQFPEIPDGSNFLFRTLVRDNAGQGGNRTLWGTQITGNDFFRALINSLERTTFQMRDGGAAIVSAVQTVNGPTAQWATREQHFNATTFVLTDCVDTVCVTNTYPVDPGTFPARSFGLFAAFNCGTGAIDDSDVAWFGIAIGPGTVAEIWDQVLHGVDCLSDGTC